jgi:hypothetical protein
MNWDITATVVLISGTSVLLCLGWIVVGLEKRISEMRQRMEDE